MAKRRLHPRKLLVASTGVMTVSYLVSGCNHADQGSSVANLMAPPATATFPEMSTDDTAAPPAYPEEAPVAPLGPPPIIGNLPPAPVYPNMPVAPVVPTAAPSPAATTSARPPDAGLTAADAAATSPDARAPSADSGPGDASASTDQDASIDSDSGSSAR
jgi:hypothetical protein